MKERFENNPQNKSEKKLKGEETASNFSELMNKEATKLAGRTKKEVPALSIEDQQTEQLEVRKKENRSQRDKAEYTELNKTDRDSERSRKKQTDHVETMLQSGREPKQIYKGGPEKKKGKMKYEENAIQTEIKY